MLLPNGWLQMKLHSPQQTYRRYLAAYTEIPKLSEEVQSAQSILVDSISTVLEKPLSFVFDPPKKVESFSTSKLEMWTLLCCLGH